MLLLILYYPLRAFVASVNITLTACGDFQQKLLLYAGYFDIYAKILSKLHYKGGEK